MYDPFKCFKMYIFYQFYSFLVFTEPVKSLYKGPTKELDDTLDLRKIMYRSVPVYRSLSIMTSVSFQGC